MDEPRPLRRVHSRDDHAVSRSYIHNARWESAHVFGRRSKEVRMIETVLSSQTKIWVIAEKVGDVWREGAMPIT
jgi:hypothetical protein